MPNHYPNSLENPTEKMANPNIPIPIKIKYPKIPTQLVFNQFIP